MSQTQVSIPTAEGDARAFVFTPDQGAGPWPVTLLFQDAFGMRPALYEMSERLAQSGYYVVLLDLYWRAGIYEPLVPAKVRGGDADAEAELARLRTSIKGDTTVKDVGAVLDWVKTQAQAKPGPVGLTGYCMGGRLALRVAGTYPDRIAAAASFHGGGLANDEPTSPHLLAPKITAKVLVCGAENDKNFPPEMLDRLVEAFDEADTDYEASIWLGVKHGWVPGDTPVHSPEGAEKHWQALIPFLDGVLK